MGERPAGAWGMGTGRYFIAACGNWGGKTSSPKPQWDCMPVAKGPGSPRQTQAAAQRFGRVA